MKLDSVLKDLEASANLRSIPDDLADGIVDFTANDYLGLGADVSLRQNFFDAFPADVLAMSSSASRLLASSQSAYKNLESKIARSYALADAGISARRALLFNSGYHANVGIIEAIASRSSLILADRLVHASIIDGIRLSGSKLLRFPHNDFDALERLLAKESGKYSSVVLIVESVYSMDGDRADIRRLADIKKRYPDIILYVDEAHAVGVCGPAGLGLSVEAGVADSVDILVGTFGKALASAGAFALVSPSIYKFLVNKARSLIFSTALPPAQILWTGFVWDVALKADDARRALMSNAAALASALGSENISHIQPWIIGDSRRALDLSEALLDEGFNVRAIRPPTVPVGTERLRFSLSAAIAPEQIDILCSLIPKLSIEG